jgi:hypothetical protein
VLGRSCSKKSASPAKKRVIAVLKSGVGVYTMRSSFGRPR